MKTRISVTVLIVAAVAVAAWGLSSQNRCETIEFHPKGVTSATFRDDRGKVLVVADKRAKNFRLHRSAVLAAFGEDRYSSITICATADIDEKTPIVLREVMLIGEAASLTPKMMVPGVVTYLLFPVGDPGVLKVAFPIGVLLSNVESTKGWENWCKENQIPLKIVTANDAGTIADALNALQRDVAKRFEDGKSSNLSPSTRVPSPN